MVLFTTNTLPILAQTANANLNLQLKTMKDLLFAENYEEFTTYVYPKVYQMMGGKDKMIEATKFALRKMKNDGFNFLDIQFSEPSKFIKKGNETQFTITQNLLMQTPKGKILGSYTLIGISNDNGKNWKFIDTSGKSKAIMLKYFPNLSPDLIIKDKTQVAVE